MDNLLSNYTRSQDMDDNTAPMATDPTPCDQAIYIPSLPPGFCKDIHAK